MKLGLLVVVAVAVVLPSFSESRIVSKCELRDKLQKMNKLPSKLEERMLATLICEVDRKSHLDTSLVKVIGNRITTTPKPIVTTVPSTTGASQKTTAATIQPTGVTQKTTAATIQPTGVTQKTTAATIQPTGVSPKTTAATIQPTGASPTTTQPANTTATATTTNTSTIFTTTNTTATNTTGTNTTATNTTGTNTTATNTTGTNTTTIIAATNTTATNTTATNTTTNTTATTNSTISSMNTTLVSNSTGGIKRHKRDVSSSSGEMAQSGSQTAENAEHNMDPWSLGLYGLFQLSDGEFCDSGYRQSQNECHTSCTAFTDDDITDDIACAINTGYWRQLMESASDSCRHTSNFFKECN